MQGQYNWMVTQPNISAKWQAYRIWGLYHKTKILSGTFVNWLVGSEVVQALLLTALQPLAYTDTFALHMQTNSRHTCRPLVTNYQFLVLANNLVSHCLSAIF